LVTKPAADAAVRGETEQAARLIERVLASDGTNAEALFVRACIRLQAGDFKAAREDTDRLESLRGRLPEVRMMRELAVARGQTPAPGWLPAFLAALKKIGANGQEQNLLQYFPTSRRPLSAEAVGRLPGADGFLLRAAEAAQPTPATLVNEAEQMVAGEQPLVVLLAAISMLSSSHLAEADKPRATTASHALIAKLARANPKEMYLQAWAALIDASDTSPLAEADVAKLERIVSSTKMNLPLAIVYEAMRRAYAKIDPAQASEAAFTAIFAAYPPQFHVVLMHRTKPMIESGDPALRHRAGLAIARLAREVIAQGSLLDLSIGSMLLGRAATLAGDSDLAADADHKRKEFQSLLRTADRLKFAAEWPIAGLMSELTERKTHGELELYRELP
jgi:tetratricopeptide (TPR) repeat protein